MVHGDTCVFIIIVIAYKCACLIIFSSYSIPLTAIVVNEKKNRSKRKSEETQRRRIRPCLKVCQIVEERCPYMLPGDRAPGYNTQYAGEPTFLCTGKIPYQVPDRFQLL